MRFVWAAWAASRGRGHRDSRSWSRGRLAVVVAEPDNDHVLIMKTLYFNFNITEHLLLLVDFNL